MEVACKTKLCSEQADLVLCKTPQGAQLVEAQHEKWRTVKTGEKCCTEQAKPLSLSPAFFLSPFFSYCALTK